jgi:pilus assembly protein CpaD
MAKMSIVLRMCAMAVLPIAAACSTPLINGPEQEFNANQRYPISVQPRMMTLNLLYNGQPDLDQNQSGQLARFAEDYRAHGSGSIGVSGPTAAATDIVVASLLETGVARTQIMVGGAQGPNPLNDIRVTYIRYVAEAPPCGDWSVSLTQTANNVLPPNFGCATQHNFAAMVADPRDLVTPDTTGQADAARRLTVLQKYRNGEATTGAKTANGALSAIGQ